VAVAPGAVITVSASGSIDCGGGAPSGPDGSTGGGTVSIQSYGGISGADIPGGPICGLALAGVFTGTTPPADPAPVRLNFASGAGTSFTSLSPALNQTFFIGDGLTGTGTGTTQTFVVPQGARAIPRLLATTGTIRGQFPLSSQFFRQVTSMSRWGTRILRAKELPIVISSRELHFPIQPRGVPLVAIAPQLRGQMLSQAQKA